MFNENLTNGLGDLKDMKFKRKNNDRSWVIGSAHHLTERNIWVKFNENCSKGFGRYGADTNWRVNPMTLKCDLDLESV